MKNWIDYFMSQVRHFTIMDFAFFKLTLLSLGILLGSYFSPFFRSIIALVWIIFLISYTAMIIATFRKHHE